LVQSGDFNKTLEYPKNHLTRHLNLSFRSRELQGAGLVWGKGKKRGKRGKHEKELK